MADTPFESVVVQADQVDDLAAILALVHSEGASTRPELGKRLNLGRTVVTQRVEQALRLGLVNESELGRSTGGRAPRLVRFDPTLGWLLLGVFGSSHASVGICDLHGVVVDSLRSEWDVGVGPEETLSWLATQFEHLLADRGDAPVWGVGVGLPGPVEFRTGRLVAPPVMPDWDGFDIRSVLEARFHAPVWVDNDVNVLALGDYTDKERADRLPVIYVKVGRGIGAGIISEGHLHRGISGGAGGIGHIRVPNHGSQVCRCGRVGCLAAIASGWALARDARLRAPDSSFLTARLEQNGRLDTQDVLDGAQRGDATCIDMVSASGRYVGEQVAAMASFFNPARVAIGGSVGLSGDLFMASVREVVYRQAPPLVTRDLQITPAAHDPHDGLRGASALVVDQLFSADAIRRWVTAGRPSPATMYETTAS